MSLFRVVIKPRKAQPILAGHPWLFAASVKAVEAPVVADGTDESAADVVSVAAFAGNVEDAESLHAGGDPTSAGASSSGEGTVHENAPEELPETLNAGDEVLVVTDRGRAVARGLYNPHSNIRVRVLSRDAEQPLDEAFFGDRIDRALAARKRRFDLKDDRSACRLVFSEGDLLSGLTVDRYGKHLLVQFTSLAMYQRRDMLIRLLRDRLNPDGIWLRTERGIRDLEGLEASDGLIAGTPPARPMFLTENGVQFGIDVQEGQKTGYYLDQRDNRRVVAGYADNARVLDLYCYSGGFGITAAVVGNAKSLVGIDSSASAIELAIANAELNGVSSRCSFHPREAEKTLDEFREEGREFDLVIVDPPRLARTRGGLNRALKMYSRVNAKAMQVVSAGGILATCSCSGLVTGQHFFGAVTEAAQRSHRSVRILESHGQPADHPVHVQCPETSYLKMLVCSID